MDSYKKLSEELLKIDGIDPAKISDTEREMFKAMLDKEVKHHKQLSRYNLIFIGIFIIAMLGLCMSEGLLEKLHIPFIAAWAVLMIGVYTALFLLWPKFYKQIKESGEKIHRLHFLVHSKYRGFPLVGKKNGKRYIDWLSVILLTLTIGLLMAFAGTGVYYLLCRCWIFASRSGAMLHIFFFAIMSLTFVTGMLYRGLKTPLEELTEIKAENYTCSRRKFSFITIAVIILAVLSLFFYIDTEEAYSVEQTIEAMHEVTTVHCFINLFLGIRMEVWVQVNPETGENEYYYMSIPGMEIVSSPDETYRYNKVTNVVTHLKGDGHVVSDIRFGRFIEDMVDSAESSHSDVKFELLDIDEGKPVIILTIEDDIQIAEFKIDSETKLPISMNLIPKKELPPGQLGQSMEDFTYNEHLPEGIFDFEIPEGAQVIEQ